MAFKGTASGGTAIAGDGSNIAAGLGYLLSAFAPGSAVELVSMKSMRRKTVPICNLPEVYEAAADLSTEPGIGTYWLINPVATGFDAHAKAEDVSHRCWVMIDVDAKRPDAGNCSATDREHDTAIVTARYILEELLSQGWPMPALIDSGNGAHILYRVDMPNSKLNQQLITSAFKKLKAKYKESAGVELETKGTAKCHSKVPGTWVTKGPSTPERPHRIAKLLNAPPSMTPVTVELFQAMAGHAPTFAREYLGFETDPPAAPIVETAASTPWASGHSRFSGVAHGAHDGWAWAAIDREAERIATAPEGQRENTLVAAAFKAGQAMAGARVERYLVVDRLTEAAHRCGLHLDASVGPAGISERIDRQLTAGAANPRYPDPEPKTTYAPSSNSKPPVDPAKPRWTDEESIIYRANTVTTRKVEWLWQGRIPLGKLTTFAGVGGLGKTFVLCYLASRITRGLAWADGAPASEAGQIIFISGEDDDDDTLVPRMMQMETMLERVSFLKQPFHDTYALADIEMLDKALRDSQPSVHGPMKAVLIDPPTSYLAGVDDHKNSELRGVLSPLASWAQRNRVAVIFNTHVNKGGAGKVEAIMRVMGGVAWVNAVRVAHLFVRDAEDKDVRFFIPMKANLSREKKGLKFRIQSQDPNVDDGPAWVEWLGEVDMTADEAVKQEDPKKKTSAASALDFLIERFLENIEWKSADLFRLGGDAGVSKNAIYAAKKNDSGIKCKMVHPEHGGEYWVWYVPPTWPAFGDRKPNLPSSPPSGESPIGW